MQGNQTCDKVHSMIWDQKMFLFHWLCLISKSCGGLILELKYWLRISDNNWSKILYLVWKKHLKYVTLDLKENLQFVTSGIWLNQEVILSMKEIQQLSWRNLIKEVEEVQLFKVNLSRKWYQKVEWNNGEKVLKIISFHI